MRTIGCTVALLAVFAGLGACVEENVAAPSASPTPTPATHTTNTPTSDTETPTTITETPDGITATPWQGTETPANVTEYPLDSPTPEYDTQTPIVVTETPTNMTPSPFDMTPSPFDITPTETDVSPTPLEVTPTPGSPTPTTTPIPVEDEDYEATIRWTQYGVPHIVADDLAGVAFGLGYAYAQNHVCILADQILKVRGERSAFFGPGTDGANLDSDFGHLTLGHLAHAEESIETMSHDARSMLKGYAAGFNRYLEVTPSDQRPEDCAGAAWVREISEIDLYAYYLSIAQLASGEYLIPALARAFPPSEDVGLAIPEHLPSLRDAELGSNGWAIGGDKTESGHSMLLANPHFPWEGELKFFESHLTVPGVMNVYGASLMGVPVINIGFSDYVAWTHTFSWACRITFYELQLAPGNPTQYRYDNQIRDLIPTTYTINVLQDDGSTGQESRTLYHSHYGPMMATEDTGWSNFRAFTYRDANAANQDLVDQFLQMNLAKSLEEFQDGLQTVYAMPWAHTMAIDSQGEAFYADVSLVPRLSEETISAWEEALEDDPLTQYAWDLGAPLLDGSTSVNEWVDAPGWHVPGVIPYYEAPTLSRRDYVFNANDNHWLANASSPLEGFSPLYGYDRIPQLPRTRMNLRHLTEMIDGGSSGADGKFNLDELQTTWQSDRGIMAELLRSAVADRCAGVREVLYEGETVDIRDVCTAISQWDALLTPTSAGGMSWREFLAYFPSEDWVDAGSLFRVPFDVNDPINTPNTLADPPDSGEDPVYQALAQAAVFLEAAGIAPDATVAAAQFSQKGSDIIPVHGGQNFEGVINVVNYSTSSTTILLPKMERAPVVNSTSDLTEDGYLVNYGSSFVMTLEMAGAFPKAKAVLTYSQSSDPRSPHYSDQTWLFSQQQWRDILFSEEDILGDPDLEVVEIRRNDP